MPVVSEFAGNSLLCHLTGRNAFLTCEKTVSLL